MATRSVEVVFEHRLTDGKRQFVARMNFPVPPRMGDILDIPANTLYRRILGSVAAVIWTGVDTATVVYV